jgi:hypothetical protein
MIAMLGNAHELHSGRVSKRFKMRSAASPCDGKRLDPSQSIGKSSTIHWVENPPMKDVFRMTAWGRPGACEAFHPRVILAQQ